MLVETAIAEKTEFTCYGVRKEHQIHSGCEIIYLDQVERNWDQATGDRSSQAVITSDRPSISFQRFLFGERAHLLAIFSPVMDSEY